MFVTHGEWAGTLTIRRSCCRKPRQPPGRRFVQNLSSRTSQSGRVCGDDGCRSFWNDAGVCSDEGNRTQTRFTSVYLCFHLHPESTQMLAILAALPRLKWVRWGNAAAEKLPEDSPRFTSTSRPNLQRKRLKRLQLLVWSSDHRSFILQWNCSEQRRVSLLRWRQRFSPADATQWRFYENVCRRELKAETDCRRIDFVMGRPLRISSFSAFSSLRSFCCLDAVKRRCGFRSFVCGNESVWKTLLSSSFCWSELLQVHQ